MSTENRCEICGGPYEIGTIGSLDEHPDTRHNFCRPHALQFWERTGQRRSPTCTYCSTSFTTFDHFATLCPTCEQRQFICDYCNRPFAPPKATTRICRTCYFDGKDKEPTYAELLQELRRMDGVKWAGLMHTGGGCWALEIRRPDNHYVMATVAFRQSEDDEWETDPDLPETEDGPWCVGYYDEEGETYVFPPGHGDEVLMPVDRRTLIAIARGFVTRKEETA